MATESTPPRSAIQGVLDLIERVGNKVPQFTAYFVYTSIGTVAVLSLASALSAATLGALPLLLGFIVVVALIDIVIVGAIPKWAIFAPVFVSLLMKLGAEPEAVLRLAGSAIRP